MAANAALLARDGQGEVTDTFGYFRDKHLLQEKGIRWRDHFVGGIWDAIWKEDSDWFNFKQTPARKKVSRGWEEHADSIAWEPHNYTPINPPWYNSAISGAYKGRKSWWSELDWENPIINRGREPFSAGVIREWDQMWWDPPVKPGESFEGLNGVDSGFTPTFNYKLDRPVTVSKWSKFVADASAQGRQIAALHDLSPQHPGLRINAGDERGGAIGLPAEEVGLAAGDFINSDAHKYPSLWRMYPRFWDSKLHEAPHEKLLFGVKVGLYAGVARAGWAVLTEPKKLYPNVPYEYAGFSLWTWRAWRPALRIYVPTYVLFPATYTGLYSLASMARGGKDDVLNPILPSAVTGALFGLLVNNTFRGFAAAGLTYAAAFVFVMARQQQYSYGGPKLLQKWSLDPAPLTAAVDNVWSQASLQHKPSIDGPVPGDYGN